MDAAASQIVLGVALAAHLAHHRLAHRHISFAEVIAATLLVAPISAVSQGMAIVVQLGMTLVLIIGSIGIARLAPNSESSTLDR